MALVMEHDAIVQRYRVLFTLVEWRVLPDAGPDPSRPGKHPHHESAYIKALLIKMTEGYEYCSEFEHPSSRASEAFTRARLPSGAQL